MFLFLHLKNILLKIICSRQKLKSLSNAIFRNVFQMLDIFMPLSPQFTQTYLFGERYWINIIIVRCNKFISVIQEWRWNEFEIENELESANIFPQMQMMLEYMSIRDTSITHIFLFSPQGCFIIMPSTFLFKQASSAQPQSSNLLCTNAVRGKCRRTLSLFLIFQIKATKGLNDTIIKFLDNFVGPIEKTIKVTTSKQ